MGQTINAGGLYSSVMPNCSCIYKFDGFTRADELNINVPGSNFYDYSKHTEIDENDNEITVPDWKVVDNKLVAQVANPWVSFRSTIPLGMVFYYGGYKEADFKLSLYYNEEKVSLYFQKNKDDEYKAKLEGVYGNQGSGICISESVFSFSNYTKSEGCFKSFATCQGYYARGIEPTESGILYILEFEGAQKDKTYLTNLVLQRNTLECLNLNNENTRLLPNNIVYPTGYLSIPVRGACRDSINTVFSWNSQVGYRKTQNDALVNRSGFIKDNNVNNNYCESCYELEEQLIKVGIDKDAEINRLDELILELDIEWLSKQEELAETEDIEAIASINQEIKNIEEKTDLLKEEKALVKSSVSKAKQKDLENIVIPHNRGLYLPILNPCLSENPKIIIDIEGSLLGNKIYLLDYNIICGALRGSSSMPTLTSSEDLDISGTYELEQKYEGSCGYEYFSTTFTKNYDFQCYYSEDKENTEISFTLFVRIDYGFIDIETGKIRHKINCTLSANIKNTSIRLFFNQGGALAFEGVEYVDSVKDICKESTIIEISSSNIDSFTNCGHGEVIFGDKISTNHYSIQTQTECYDSDNNIFSGTVYFPGSIGTGVGGCKDVIEETDDDGGRLVIDNNSECHKIKLIIRAE